MNNGKRLLSLEELAAIDKQEEETLEALWEESKDDVPAGLVDVKEKTTARFLNPVYNVPGRLLTFQQVAAIIRAGLKK